MNREGEGDRGDRRRRREGEKEKIEEIRKNGKISTTADHHCNVCNSTPFV